MLKKILIVILIAIVAGAGYAAYLWNKPAPKAENESAIKIDAKTLFNAYQNEKHGDSLYLGKWLQVTGNIQSVDTNQDGQKVFVLETGDLMQAVICVMRDKTASQEKGKTVIIKGKCTGLANDVVVKDCIELPE